MIRNIYLLVIQSLCELFFFNFTILKQIVADTNQLYSTLIDPLWYLMTFITFAATIYLVYYGVVGGIKMLKEAQKNQVNGED